MGKFILYSVAGTLATFAVFVHLSLLPHLAKNSVLLDIFSPEAVLAQLPAFLLTLVTSWLVWWSVSGILFLLLHSLGKFTGIVLFILSFGIIYAVTACFA